MVFTWPINTLKQWHDVIDRRTNVQHEKHYVQVIWWRHNTPPLLCYTWTVYRSGALLSPTRQMITYKSVCPLWQYYIVYWTSYGLNDTVWVLLFYTGISKKLDLTGTWLALSVCYTIANVKIINRRINEWFQIFNICNPL